MTKEMAINILRGDVLGTNEQTHEAVFMAVKALKAKPKHGHWIVDEKRFGNDFPHCSSCRAILEEDSYHYRNNNYCYHCGADMREKESAEGP